MQTPATEAQANRVLPRNACSGVAEHRTLVGVVALHFSGDTPWQQQVAFLAANRPTCNSSYVEGMTAGSMLPTLRLDWRYPHHPYGGLCCLLSTEGVLRCVGFSTKHVRSFPFAHEPRNHVLRFLSSREHLAECSVLRFCTFRFHGGTTFGSARSGIAGRVICRAT